MINFLKKMIPLLLLVSCANVGNPPPDILGRISVDGNLELLAKSRDGTSVCELYGEDLLYIGDTEVELFECLMRDRHVRRLHITSHGGSVEFAIASAQEVLFRKIDVFIYGFCSSSCANYIIPAANKVTLRYPTMILLHGAPPGDDRALRESIARAFEKFDLPESEKKPLMDKQVEKLMTTRRLHDDFIRQVNVGAMWYDPPKAPPEVADRRVRELAVMGSFLVKCFPDKVIESDQTLDEEAVNRLSIGLQNTVLVVGIDFSEPAACASLK